MNNLHLSKFANKDNIKLLWDVLLDELTVDVSNAKNMQNIRTIFDSNLNLFVSRTNLNIPLIQLNKTFLGQMLVAVNSLFPKENLKKIIITNEEVNEPYKIEDIQAERQTEFDLQLEKKRKELETYMTLKKPNTVDFSDKFEDGRITAMDELVAEKIASRNMDIEQISTLYNSNTNANDTWLKSKETSVKMDKINPNININPPSPINIGNSKLKYLNFDQNNNVSLNLNTDKTVKKVSWNNSDEIIKEESITNNTNNTNNTNIFSKLKKTKVEEELIPESIAKEIEIEEQRIKNSNYLSQQSVSLSSIEPINKPSININTPLQKNVTVLQNAPLLPNNELKEQINTMNKRIDSLYEMMNEIRSMLEINNNNLISCNNNLININNNNTNEIIDIDL